MQLLNKKIGGDNPGLFLLSHHTDGCSFGGSVKIILLQQQMAQYHISLKRCVDLDWRLVWTLVINQACLDGLGLCRGQ